MMSPGVATNPQGATGLPRHAAPGLPPDIRLSPTVAFTPLILAPMAGVTDVAFRRLARRLGAGLAVAEMLIADTGHWQSKKSSARRDHTNETGPVSVQIAGADPAAMARAARESVAHGADIIDINMGCPAKKVCGAASGSALLRTPGLVARILDAVVNAVPETPVTLKIRTGYSPESRNALTIARLAETSGVRLLSIHGRTREDFFTGKAEHETLASVVAETRLPVIANGDIDSPVEAARVLRETGAAGVMIGRAAQGNPWVFGAIRNHLDGYPIETPGRAQIRAILGEHLEGLYRLYGDTGGVRIARKHIRWYCDAHPGEADGVFWQDVRVLETPAEQMRAVGAHFGRQ